MDASVAHLHVIANWGLCLLLFGILGHASSETVYLLESGVLLVYLVEVPVLRVFVRVCTRPLSSQLASVVEIVKLH